MPQQINLDQLPKQYCENIIVGSNNQAFTIVPIVGVNATAFAISPEHAKNLVKILAEHVEKFEKTVRQISDLNAPTPSPIQSKDLPPGK